MCVREYLICYSCCYLMTYISRLPTVHLQKDGGSHPRRPDRVSITR